MGAVVKLPEELYLGIIENEWPIRAFESVAHALHWLGEDPRKRHLWHVVPANPRKMIYVPPGEPRLEFEPEQ